MSVETSARPVWQARLAALDPRAQALNDSLGVDRRLWPEELALSRAYALSLAECGVMSEAEAKTLIQACDGLEADLAAGAVALAGEDVHGAVEAELEKGCGDPARKLHTGRSRNDQVATLLRLHLMRIAAETVEQVRELERALVRQARAAGDQVIAAQTHMQPAQPVLLSHWWLAHASALERDEARFEAAREAADCMPLGAGALAGTPLRYDRAALALRLGFSRLASNSIDAVGDRDFALEFLNAAALLGVHLSRLAEDLVLACTPAFGWFAAPAGFATGSSLLPNKRNPDVFELARGKSARLITNAERLAVLLKGLPSSYQKDLQEDKETVFDSADTLRVLLAALAPAIAGLVPNTASMERALTPDLLAVELADALVEEGLPFRDAHAQVGALWALAERAGVEPADLAEDERLALSPHFTSERLAALDVPSAMARRDHAPGAGATSVADQLARLEARLGLAEIEGVATSTRGEVTATNVVSGAWPAGSASAAGVAGAFDPALRSARAHAGTDASAPASSPHAPAANAARTRSDGIVLRRARVADVPGIAAVMAEFVSLGLLLPRSTSELYHALREFHVAEHDGVVVACAALRLLWEDVGEVRSLAVRPDHRGLGLGADLVKAVIDDARVLALPRVIALTREVAFFERCGFKVLERDALPRKVWTDCVRCPRRHACDEVAVAFDLVPGASDRAEQAGRSWTLPIPPRPRSETLVQPIVG